MSVDNASHLHVLPVSIIILQYNNWEDTCRCVESIFQSDDQPEHIIIVDNGSSNMAVEKLRSWFNGSCPVSIPDLPGLEKKRKLSPCEILEIDCSEQGEIYAPQCRCALLTVKKNVGYAAGNNIGLQAAMNFDKGQNPGRAFLILNNDTLLTPAALGAMYERLFSSIRPGLCGPLLRYCYGDLPTQCLAGGIANYVTGLAKFIGKGLSLEEALKIPAWSVEKKLNFICGACVMISRDFLEQIGLMDEGYFLYCEELDWGLRAKDRFDLVYAQNALVYHMEGRTTGWNNRHFSIKRLCGIIRSRLRFTLKFFPYFLPTVILGLGYAGLRLIWRRLKV